MPKYLAFLFNYLDELTAILILLASKASLHSFTKTSRYVGNVRVLILQDFCSDE